MKLDKQLKYIWTKKINLAKDGLINAIDTINMWSYFLVTFFFGFLRTRLEGILHYEEYVTLFGCYIA